MNASSEYESDPELVSLAISAARSGAAGRTATLNRRLLEADSNIPGPHEISGPLRIAIVSLLFNWPSTGGGIVHTAELAQFLAQDGIDICHFYAVFPSWSIGSVSERLPYNSCAIQFDEQGWNRPGITAAFQQALRSFQPDAVIVTDSWNSKGLLATAASEYPYFLRLAAMESLCPLNNVRLLASPEAGVRQCHKSQLSDRRDCVRCVRDNQHCSGALHSAERTLAGFESREFGEELVRSFSQAEGILVVNPEIASLCQPFATAVHVIPNGFDARRFENLPQRAFGEGRIRLLFAGLVDEFMKGFHVLFEAAARLWEERQDFQVLVTGDESSFQAPFLRYASWKDQRELPRLMADCDIVVVPTVAQEALGRTAVEAMGAARPVVASRLGGLPFTVVDGTTGLLFDPGNSAELAASAVLIGP